MLDYEIRGKELKYNLDARNSFSKQLNNKNNNGNKNVAVNQKQNTILERNTLAPNATHLEKPDEDIVSQWRKGNTMTPFLYPKSDIDETEALNKNDANTIPHGRPSLSRRATRRRSVDDTNLSISYTMEHKISDAVNPTTTIDNNEVLITKSPPKKNRISAIDFYSAN